MPASRFDDSTIEVVESPGRYAVLLNALAKGWTGDQHHRIQRLVASEDLYLTDDFRQAEHTVDTLLSRDYDIVFTGGGDGTIMFLVNAIEQRIRDGVIAREDAPPVGILRMGSGNAIATYLGTESATAKLRALRAGAPVAIHTLDMLEGRDGEMFPFAGIGWDAEVLNDYEDFKASVRETALESYAIGLGGYVASITSRTLPRVLRTDAVQVRVRNHGEHAYKIDADGELIEEYGPGDMLYDGPVQTCAAATVSYWGYRIRMFPYATLKPGYAMLRCYNGSVGNILAHLPSFWRGRFTEGDCVDFLFSDVEIRSTSRPLPCQVTGEGAGHAEEVRWQVADPPVKLAVPLH